MKDFLENSITRRKEPSLCMICGERAQYYFGKTYTESPFDSFMEAIGPVSYYRCTDCGFVFSQTHLELDPHQWGRLNEQCHHFFEDPAAEKKGNQPPYLEQAMLLAVLSQRGLVDLLSGLDYAAGYGTLSRLLDSYWKLRLPIFDFYVQDGDPTRYLKSDDLGNHGLVVNSAMFEHVLTRQDLDSVNALVRSDGALMIHTVVCERVPPDPEWFYLRPPVHTAFHTNESMRRLMAQWGYAESIYCPKAKSWILFKTADPTRAATCQDLNREMQCEWLLHSTGFVDYWKGF